jgi:feruloyl esterase
MGGNAQPQVFPVVTPPVLFVDRRRQPMPDAQLIFRVITHISEYRPQSDIVESAMNARTRLAALPLLVLAGQLARAATCDSLITLAIPNTEISSATAVPPGPLSLGGRGGPRNLPAFCRVLAVAHPAPGSEIHLEVWLPPAETWNHKFVGTGNGGYASDLSYTDMEAALRKGYATAGSDTGHQGGDLKFAVGHPEKIDDWGWRAIHVMTETAKLIVRSYYAALPAQSYFNGCSTGGHQALSEGQRFPADYDGIVAGDPGNNRVRLNVGFLWSWLATHPENGGPLSAAALPLLHKAALAACGDPIQDPSACRFDPAVLQCKSDAVPCLTPSDVAAAQKVYGGARNPRTGEQIFPGWPRGSELGWSLYFVGQPEPARLDFWRYWVFHDPNWNPRTFDFDRDVAFADAHISAAAATSADLSAFAKRSGKLIVYHGAADPVAPPQDSVEYYQRVRQSTPSVESFYRLFLIPGMGHCTPAPDALSALDSWVTGGVAPDRLPPALRPN